MCVSITWIFGSGSIFCIFASVTCILIGKNGEYGKTHAKILDSVCNGLKTKSKMPAKINTDIVYIYYCFYCILYQIYAALVSIRHL